MQRKSAGYDKALSDSNVMNDEDWIIRLGFLIHDTARLRRIVVDEVFKPLGITRSQAWLLAYLSRADGLPQSVLAEQMGLGKVALGGLIDRLESAGMIERRSHPSDRRINNIYLTDAGITVTKSMRKLTLDANKEILEGVTMDEVRQVVEILSKLKRNLNKMKEDFYNAS